MATLSSASTTAQCLAEYDDTASYEEDASADKARRHVTACVILVSRLSDEMGKTTGEASERLRVSIAKYERSADNARGWLAANNAHRAPGGSAPRTRGFSLRNFRD